METAYHTNYHENLLDDVDYSLCPANHGKRIANYFIDVIATYLAIFVVAVILIFATKNPNAFGLESDSTSTLRIIGILFFLVFYAVVEGLSHGKSLGKLITGTRAVNLDGTPIGFTTAFVRSLIRLIPFEPFSALGSPSTPWHDKWTNTFVVDEQLSRLPGTREEE
jgi:uncharacterized RDD family membrane protein YckC